MKSPKTFNLTLYLPIIVFLSFVFFLAISVFQSYRFIESETIENSINFVKQDMSSLQFDMENDIRTNRFNDAKQALSLRGSYEHFILLIALNEKDEIIASTDLSLLYKNGTSIESIVPEFMDLVKTSLKPKLNLQKTQIHAYYPLRLERRAGEIRSSRSGMLFLIYDLRQTKNEIWYSVLSSVIPQAVFLFFILFVIIYIIRTFLLKPMNYLISSTTNFKDNVETMTIHIDGRGELVKLAKAFNQMIARRLEYEAALEKTNLKINCTLAELAEQKFALDQHSIVSITDLNGMITYVNSKFSLISGYSRDELIGQNHRMLKSGKHQQNFYRQIYETITKGAVWHGEICNKTKNEEFYWVETTIVPFKNEAGIIVSYVSIRNDITGRMNTERQLRESDERYDLAMSVSNDGIWDWDVKSNKVIFDKRYYTMAGYLENEFPHAFDEWKKRVHPDDLELTMSKVKKSFMGEQVEPFEIEFRFLKKDKSYMWILSRGEVISFDADNNPVRILGTHMDITLRKEVEFSLSDKQLQLQAILDYSNILISSKDLKGNLTLANKYFDVLEGFSSENLVGKNIYDLLPEDLADELWKNDLRAQKKAIEVEERVPHKDGTIHDYLTRKFPLINSEQKLIGTGAISIDITARKEVEQSLQQIKDYLDLVLYNMPIGVAILEGPEFHYFRVNRYLAGINGHSVDEHIGKRISDVIPDSADTLVPMLNKVKETGVPVLQREYSQKLASNQKPIYLTDWQIPIKNSENKIDSILMVVLDITELKETQNKLRHIQKMEAIGQLTGGIAHDFNNILGIIVGNIDLLEKQFKHDDKAIRRINAASQAADRATKLTRQLLSFSRTKLTETKTISVNDLLENMREIYLNALGHQVVFEEIFEESLWSVSVDPGELQDVILNLMINARDAIDDDGRVTLSTENRVLSDEFCQKNIGAIPGEYVLLSISDNGEGISDEDQKNIFEPFFTTKEPGRGTGLGLSLVFGFVKRSSGYIQVISEKGKGSCFNLYLPKCHSEISETSDFNNLNFEQLSIEGGKESVLIVDDEIELVALAKETLVNLGYKIYTAYSATEALQLVNLHPDISLVFSDIVMPGGLTGFDLAENICRNQPSTKILLTSGFKNKAEEKNNASNYKFKILNKPYMQSDLAILIRKSLDNITITES